MPYYGYGYRRYYSKKYITKLKRAAVRRALNQVKKSAAFSNQPVRLDQPLEDQPAWGRGSAWSKLAFGESAATANPGQLRNRKAFRFKGAGAYSVRRFVGDVSRIGEGIKKTYNAWVPKQLRDQVIGMASTGLSKVGGQGLYGGQGAYRSNSLMEGGAASLDIGAQNDETDSIVLSNCESVMEIYAPTIASGSSQFAMQTIEVNPGLHAFSRKLAAIAKNYVSYDLLQLVFEIRPLISESNVNNGITGTLMAAFQYDPVQAAPDNKDDMLDLSGSVSGRIIDALTVGVECDPSKVKDTSFFCRTGPVPLGRDVDEYDPGKFIIATNNIPAAFSNMAIAELYVYYTVRLKMWKPDRAVPQDLFVQSEDRTESAIPVTSTGLCVAQQSSLGGSLTSSGAGIWLYTFPANYSGIVQITLRVEGINLTRTSYTFAGTTGTANAVSTFFASGGAGDTPNNTVEHFSATLESITHSTRIRSAVGGVNNTVSIQLTGGAATGTITQWSFEVLERSDQLFTSRTNATPVFVNVSTGAVQSV